MNAVWAALAGAGFTLLVRASPLARIPHKPFTCRTCLSGWGALLYGLAFACGTDGPRGVGRPPWAVWVTFGADELATLLLGVGGAALVFALLDLGEAAMAALAYSSAAGAGAEAGADLPPPPPTVGTPGENAG